MTEYISRDKALKVIDALDDISDAWGCAIPMHTIKEKIKEIPSADVVKRKRGEWKQRSDPYGWFETIPVCSICGCTTKWRETYMFCPNCGARMVTEDV